MSDDVSNGIKLEFGRRLQAAMIEKGWNQSELARRANDQLPKAARGQKRGRHIGRDSISHYIRGKMFPLPTYLAAIAKALGRRPEDLMPPPQPVSPYEIRGLPDGRVALTLRTRTMREETALKIMALLAEEDRQT